MMKKNYILVLFSLYVSAFLHAQPADYKLITDNEAIAVLVDEIVSATQATHTLQCDFVQEKTSTLLVQKAVSNGKIYYRQPADLRWEYTSPKAFRFVLKNGQSKRTDHNRIFQDISRLVVQLINGNELQNNKNFAVRFFQNDQQIWVEMTPQNKRLQTMLARIYLTFDLQASIATSIEMHDATGDITTIIFRNPKRNETLQDSLFDE